MAYTKTTWVNGTSPAINATNLNNIESGIENATNGNILFPDGTVGTPSITFSSDTNTGIFRPSADTIAFVEGGVESVRINANGSVSISSSNTIDSSALSVYGKIATGTANTSGNYRSLSMTGTSGSQVLNFYNGSNTATLTSTGTWTNASDRRIKTNIRDIEYDLETIKQTQPRTFDFIDMKENMFGFIAQELKEVIPEAVHGDEDTFYSVD